MKQLAKWWTLMQVKSRRYQESRRNKEWQLLQNQDRNTYGESPTSDTNHQPEESQNHASPKVLLLQCQFEFFVAASDLFLLAWGQRMSARKGPWGGPRGSKEAVSEISGRARMPKRAPNVLQGVPGGALWRPTIAKVGK